MHLYERPDHDFLWDGRLWQKRPIQADHTCATALAVHRASDDAHAARLQGGVDESLVKPPSCSSLVLSSRPGGDCQP